MWELDCAAWCFTFPTNSDNMLLRKSIALSEKTSLHFWRTQSVKPTQPEMLVKQTKSDTLFDFDTEETDFTTRTQHNAPTAGARLAADPM